MVKRATILGIDLYECSAMSDGTIGIGYTIDTIELFTFNKNAKMKRVPKEAFETVNQDGVAEQQQDQLRDEQENGQLDLDDFVDGPTEGKEPGKPVAERKRRRIPTELEMLEAAKLMTLAQRKSLIVNLKIDLDNDFNKLLTEKKALAEAQAKEAEELRQLMEGNA